MSRLQPTIVSCVFSFFFNDTATTEIYTLSLHDALPIPTTSPDPGRSPHRALASRRRHGTQEVTMPKRSASAIWHGNLPEGNGTMRLDSGAYEGPYSFSSRFEEGTGSNPEELIA